MKQMTFADAEYAGKRKQTRKELFLIEMGQVVPWKGLIALIEPHYPKGEGGRPAYPLMAMLRIHLMQNWFGYSDPAMEEALYETTILRQFAGLSLERIPDETTILNFRRLLEKHELAAGILGVINGYLGDRGLSLRQGTLRQFTIGHTRHRLVVKMEIIGNGPGIPPELQETIFYPMVSGRPDGTGLGLAITQNIISQHQGLIECESHPGHTTFSIFLPLEQGAPTT